MTQSHTWPTGLQSPGTVHWDWPPSAGLQMTKEGGDGRAGKQKGERRGKKEEEGDFPGSPVVKTPCFYCRGHGFNPWSGN